MPDYLLVSQRVIISETHFQATNPEEAKTIAKTIRAPLDSTAFSQINETNDLYEAIVLTNEQIQAAIAELVTYGYEDITERILAERQETIAEYAPEGYQDEVLCVLYKKAGGPFYCHASQELVLKLMQERACHALKTPSDPHLDKVRFAGNVEDYELKNTKYQGKTFIAVKC